MKLKKDCQMVSLTECQHGLLIACFNHAYRGLVVTYFNYYVQCGVKYHGMLPALEASALMLQLWEHDKLVCHQLTLSVMVHAYSEQFASFTMVGSRYTPIFAKWLLTICALINPNSVNLVQSLASPSRLATICIKFPSFKKRLENLSCMPLPISCTSQL